MGAARHFRSRSKVMDYHQFLKDHGVMPWQYPIDPPPDYVWELHVNGSKYDGPFESTEIAHAWVQHHNDTMVWVKANLPNSIGDFITAYQLVEVPRPRRLSAEEIAANIEHVLTVMYLQGDLD
jgi:hypothetical protein